MTAAACAACPVTPPASCPAVTRGHRAFCKSYAADPLLWGPELRRLAGVADAAVPAPAWPDPDLARRAERCPFRVEVPADGGCCARTRCAPEGRRPGRVVNILDCCKCVQEFEALTPLTPGRQRHVNGAGVHQFRDVTKLIRPLPEPLPDLMLDLPGASSTIHNGQDGQGPGNQFPGPSGVLRLPSGSEDGAELLRAPDHQDHPRAIPRPVGVRCAHCPLPARAVCGGAFDPSVCNLPARDVASWPAYRHSRFQCRDRRVDLPARVPDRPRPRKDPRPPPGPRVVIRSHLYPDGGYGRIAEHLGRGLEALDVPVAYDPISTHEAYLPLPEFVASRVDRRPDDDWELLLTGPGGRITPGKAAVWFSMWEVTRLPQGTPAQLNRAAAVVVPCHWCATVYSGSGVIAPIRVVPLGVATEEGFRWAGPPPEDGPVVFGTAGRFSHGGERKGVLRAAAAFLAAFPGDRDVRLQIKCLPDDREGLKALPADPRIEVHSRPLAPPEMAAWCRSLSAGLYATCGEGWGMHCHETMAVGRPLVAPAATGLLDYFDARHGWPVDVAWTPARDFYRKFNALWAEPDFDGLVAALRACAGDPIGRIMKARPAAAQAARFTWENTARRLLAVLAEAGMVEARETVLA